MCTYWVGFRVQVTDIIPPKLRRSCWTEPVERNLALASSGISRLIGFQLPAIDVIGAQCAIRVFEQVGGVDPLID
jgi:hypothetical protein